MLRGAIPLILFTLGGSLSGGPGGGDGARGGDGGAALLISGRTMAGVVFAKLVVVPACNVTLVLLASKVMQTPDRLMLLGDVHNALLGVRAGRGHNEHVHHRRNHALRVISTCLFEFCALL